MPDVPVIFSFKDMRKTIITAACVAMGFGSLPAAENVSVKLGYTDGLESEQGYSLVMSDVEVSAAIYLPAELLAKYPGCELSGVQGMLHSRLNIDSMDLWVRSSLEGENILSATMSRESDPALAKGWNRCDFATPYIIPDSPEQGLYVGVTYHQTGAANGLAYSTQGTPGGAYLLTPGGEWTDVSADHTFFIDAILTGDALPAVNLKLETANFAPYYVIDKGVYTGAGVVRNLGTERVTGFDLELKMQDVAQTFTEHFDCDLAYGETYEFSYAFPMEITQAEGEREAVLTVVQVNGKADADMTDNSVKGTYQVVPYDMTRRVLVEEFTTERCPNCPRVGELLHEMLEQPRYGSLVVPLCHHSGYGTDRFTIPSDEAYLWFYSPKYIFAPSVMVDRMVSSNGVPPVNPYDLQALTGMVDVAAAVPAEVSVSLHAECDGEVLRATVRGSKVVETLCENPRLVCVVTEDNVPSSHQEGYYGPGTYMHQHVSRAVNEAFGVPVPFEGDEYEYTVTLPISNVADRENMNLVAYIFNYDEGNRNNCPVMNASILPYGEMTVSSVTSIEAGTESPVEWYTISGLRLGTRPAQSGIYIERRGSVSRKVVIR